MLTPGKDYVVGDVVEIDLGDTNLASFHGAVMNILLAQPGRTWIGRVKSIGRRERPSAQYPTEGMWSHELLRQITLYEETFQEWKIELSDLSEAGTTFVVNRPERVLRVLRQAPTDVDGIVDFLLGPSA